MAAKNHGQMFSCPENDRHVMTSWEELLTGSDPHARALRGSIDHSWRRCLGANVDPSRSSAPPPLDDSLLSSLRGECIELVSASTPVMALARDFLSETGTVMVLTDNAGTILNLEGDSALRSTAENVHLMSGANWSERACGTNAIGTAIEVGHPIQIHSAEHFCEGIKRWSCSATVVRDPYDGQILGVIDISGLSPSYSRSSLALVVATAGKIEARLARLQLASRYRLLEGCMERLTMGTQDGVIVFDRRGRLVKANPRAALVMADMGGAADPHGVGVTGLSIDWPAHAELPTSVPPWVKREWLDTVVVDGECLGAVLTLPARSHGSRAVAAATARAEAHSGADGFNCIIGRSKALSDAMARARQLSRSRVPVLLLGETGVGKDRFAQAIHAHGRSLDAPFIALNCGSLSREILSSELFGYAEGAFTGAKRGGMIGKIEAAEGGTLFLDEIGEMPIDLQPHFLRVLEQGEVYRLGESKPRKVSFRLIAATNRDLRVEVQNQRFRMDLYYRVAVTSISIPPLRARVDDIPALIRHYVDSLSVQHGLEPLVFNDEALRVMQQYEWPGNIRELRNVVESLLLTVSGGLVLPRDLPDYLSFGAGTGPDALHFAAAPGVAKVEFSSLERTECEAIRHAIRECQGNLTAVARELGIAKSTVYMKLKRFGLDGLVSNSRTTRA